jgi:hypothetical protein
VSIFKWINEHFNLLKNVSILNGMVNNLPLPASVTIGKESDLRVIFEQARDRVAEQTGDADKLYQRSVVLLGICITALTSILGYVGTHLEWSLTNVLLIGIAIILWVSCALLKPNITPQPYSGLGNEPDELLREDFFSNLSEGKSPEWYILLAEIKNYQKRIDLNGKQNARRAKNIKEAINWLYCIPIVSLVILVIGLCLEAAQ